MALFRQIHTTFWNDVKVQEDFTPEDRYFFLYLLTNQQTKQIGVYQITKKQMAFELGYTSESINALIQRFENHHKLIQYDEQTREIVIFNWGKYNLKKAGKPIEDLIRKELQTVKNKALLRPICEQIEQPAIKSIVEAFIRDDDDTSTKRDMYRSTKRGQEKEEEKEKEIEQEEQQEEKEEKEEKEGQHVVVENNPIHFYMDNFGVINPFMAEEIDQWVQDLNTELVVKAMQITLENNKRSWSYVKGILKDWHSKNFTTVKDVEAAQAEFRRLQQCKKRTGSGYARKEAVPDWLHQQEEMDAVSSSADTEEERKRLAQVLAQYKR
ncbi:DnaD domain protein [Bacillus tropicus]|uniref:DnaD domain-containing protein n=1 Tax=Bacillus tropicus TaxID=2026188 RepID=UPI003D242FC4